MDRVALAELANIVSGGTPSRDQAIGRREIPLGRLHGRNRLPDQLLEQTEIGTPSPNRVAGCQQNCFPPIGSAHIARQSVYPRLPSVGIDQPGVLKPYPQTGPLTGRFFLPDTCAVAAGSNVCQVSTDDVKTGAICPHLSPSSCGPRSPPSSPASTPPSKTEALIAKYQQIKAGLMHDLFTRGVLPQRACARPRTGPGAVSRETERWVAIPKIGSRLLRIGGNMVNGSFGPSKRSRGSVKGHVAEFLPTMNRSAFSRISGAHHDQNNFLAILIARLGEGSVFHCRACT